MTPENPAAASALEQLLPNEFTPKVELRSVAELRPLGRRARRHSPQQIGKVRDSIKQFGFLNPILADETGAVLAGLARLEAAQQLGMRSVPVIVASHMTAAEKRAYVLAENKLAELAEWDREILGEELRELAALDLDFDLEIIGFTGVEIDALTDLKLDDGADDEPEVPSHPVTERGDHWQLGDHRAYCGDATDPVAHAVLMSGEKARTAFLDGPYNVPIQGHVTSNPAHREFPMGVGEMDDPRFTGFLATGLRNVATHMIDGGLIYFCMDWRHALHTLNAQIQAGLSQVNLCVWAKPGGGGQGSFYRSRHELVFVFKVGSKPHLNRVQLGKHGRNRTNVWEYPGVSGLNRESRTQHAAHPTPKNVDMVQDALLDSSEKGDVVVDVFGGSGTTLIAAERSGRRARLMEIDPRYVDVIIERWQGFTGRQATLVGSDLTFSQLRAQRAALVSQPPGMSSPPPRVRVRRRPAR
ncbi:DNA methyltransferase [Phenylobacterium sp.]|uniref:site-specific DNA-methyltransferase n=1 Tax=Phenylobacterium sp. TaxID=1871053 RepID=UPI0025F9FBA3|nr:DNA methyltransferase [Phenylobacterium sp.]MBX3485130.1 ParB N-terminal domain-containing protein [Phenylobacterium sp.]MCW5759197.1 ParB N-terminal domain-containing protein [Phenylobacterium sp.]